MPYKYVKEDPKWYENYHKGFKHGRRESNYKDPRPNVIREGHKETPYHYGYVDGNFNKKVKDNDPEFTDDASGDSSYREIYENEAHQAEETAKAKRAASTDNGKGFRNLAHKEATRGKK